MITHGTTSEPTRTTPTDAPAANDSLKRWSHHPSSLPRGHLIDDAIQCESSTDEHIVTKSKQGISGYERSTEIGEPTAPSGLNIAHFLFQL